MLRIFNEQSLMNKAKISLSMFYKQMYQIIYLLEETRFFVISKSCIKYDRKYYLSFTFCRPETTIDSTSSTYCGSINSPIEKQHY